ncbi:O-antigen ligase family protein [Photobacterium sp. DNB23_23_1]
MKFLVPSNNTLIYYVMSFIAAIFLLDPADNSFGFESNSFLKSIPILIFLIFFTYYILLKVISSRGVVYSSSLYFFPYVLFFILFILGSLFSIKDGVELSRTALSRSLLVLFALAPLSMTGRFDIVKYVRFISILSIVFSIFLIVMQVIWWSGLRFVDLPHIFHEQIVFCIIGALYSSLNFKNIKKYFFTIICLLPMILTFKNTGYLIVVIFSVLVCFYRMKTFRSPYLRVLVWGLFLFLIASVAFSIAYIIMYPPEFLPSGSPEVRVQTYLYRLFQFSESPFWGTFFYGDYIFELPTIDGSIYVPSHSDILDLLAFGGSIGLILSLYGFLCSILYLLRFEISSEYKSCFVLIGYITSFILLMSVNPVINQWKMAFFYWFFSGVITFIYHSQTRINYD